MAGRPKRKRTRTSTKPARTIFTVRLPPDLMWAMQERADRRLISRNKLIETLIREHLATPMPDGGEATSEHQEAVNAGQVDLFA